MTNIKNWKEWKKECLANNLECKITLSKNCKPEMEAMCTECYEFYVQCQLGRVPYGL